MKIDDVRVLWCKLVPVEIKNRRNLEWMFLETEKLCPSYLDNGFCMYDDKPCDAVVCRLVEDKEGDDDR